MADPVVTTPVSPAPGPEPVAAAPAAAVQPAAALPAAEPAPASTTPIAAPAAEPAPAVAKPAEPAPQSDQPAAPAPTLLEKFDKEKTDAEAAKAPAAAAAVKPAIPAAKPTEPAKPGEVPPKEAAAAAAPAPVEYKYTLPETIKMDDALKSEVHAAFDNFRANPTEGAQTLIDLHEKQMRDFAQFMDTEQRRVWAETRQGWAKKVLADPEIGGSGHQTAMGAIARMRDLLVAEKDRPAFEEMLRTTGVGDHPEFLRALHQAARYYDEPTLPPPNPRPPAGNGQKPSRRLRDIYDHPRSSADGRL